MITEETIDKLTIELGKGIVTDLDAKKWQKNNCEFLIRIGVADKLLLLSHSVFTQICSWHQGDYRLYSLSIRNRWKLEEGTYLITYAQKRQEGSCKLIINLGMQEKVEKDKNEHCDIPTAYAWYK